jgi:5-methylcytosine-specific restriction protein A
MPKPGWPNSTRRETLPPDWPNRVALVRARVGGRCEWPGWLPGRTERLTGEPCRQMGTDCDHIGDRDDHRLANLQWLCGMHHQRKTIDDRRTRRRSDRRPPERHPGLRG